MPRTKGSKNRVTASTDFDAQIVKLRKDKAMLEEGLSKTVAQIEELKTDIKSLREGLKPQKAEIKRTEKEIAKLEAKKAATEAKAAEAAKKVEAEAVLKKLLASGRTDLLKDFVSSRTRRKFSAFLVRGTDGKVGFEFEKREPKEKAPAKPKKSDSASSPDKVPAKKSASRKKTV